MKSVIMYRPGSSVEVEGVPCDVVRMTIHDIPQFEADGWFKSVHEFGGNNEDSHAESDEVRHDGHDEEDEEVGTKEPQEIREAAKVAGIDGWDTKRIKTLTFELAGD